MKCTTDCVTQLNLAPTQLLFHTYWFTFYFAQKQPKPQAWTCHMQASGRAWWSRGHGMHSECALVCRRGLRCAAQTHGWGQAGSGAQGGPVTWHRSNGDLLSARNSSPGSVVTQREAGLRKSPGNGVSTSGNPWLGTSEGAKGVTGPGLGRAVSPKGP